MAHSDMKKTATGEFHLRDTYSYEIIACYLIITWKDSLEYGEALHMPR